ncbi:MAG: glycogen debranching enzyme GlgX, partial [Salaquimonas sp.]|nr:glycogen debranching enzyme GlgX [Salaquimonas sp.]
RVLIAEPWDIGPGGYQLGHFPEAFLEWNDRYRDTIRRFWRGDDFMLGPIATALAGSSEVFGGNKTRSVNFIAAHDGFTLADLVAYRRKHNQANGEHNRDGHNENFSWNNGAEGETGDPAVLAARRRDVAGLLSLLFASRGTIMLTAGDEFGRSQQGNNNAYCQDNELTWVDWQARDVELQEHAYRLAQIRRQWPHLTDTRFLDGVAVPGHDFPDVAWLAPSGVPLTTAEWEMKNGGALAMLLVHPHEPDGPRLAVLVNRLDEMCPFVLPDRLDFRWHDLVAERDATLEIECPPRTIMLLGERRTWV